MGDNAEIVCVANVRVLITVKDAAERLKCGLSTIYELFHDGKVKGIKLGKKERGIRILEQSLNEFIDRQTKPAQAQPNYNGQVALPPPLATTERSKKLLADYPRKVKSFEDYVPVNY